MFAKLNQENSRYQTLKEEDKEKRQVSKTVWDAKSIQKCLINIDNGIEDYRPFCDKNINRKAPNILYDFSIEEMEEMKRCAKDIVHFADKYCFAMTDEGIQKINLRDYQRNMLRHFQGNRQAIILSSRQIGKCCGYYTYVNFSDDIYNKNKKLYIKNIGTFFHSTLKKQRKLTIFEKVKIFLYNILEKV